MIFGIPSPRRLVHRRNGCLMPHPTVDKFTLSPVISRNVLTRLCNFYVKALLGPRENTLWCWKDEIERQGWLFHAPSKRIHLVDGRKINSFELKNVTRNVIKTLTDAKKYFIAYKRLSFDLPSSSLTHMHTSHCFIAGFVIKSNVVLASMRINVETTPLCINNLRIAFLVVWNRIVPPCHWTTTVRSEVVRAYELENMP